MTEEEFLTTGRTYAHDAKQRAGQMCQADYYAGMKRLMAGDKEGAAELFKKSTDTGEKGYTEYISAAAELAALKK